MKQVEIEDGENLWVVETTVEGSKVVLCVGVDESDAENLLRDLSKRFPSIWPELDRTMRTGFEEYGHSEDYPPESFVVSASRMTPGVYMGDESSFVLRFEFAVEKFSDSIPIYDFFLNDDLAVVHHQPVF